MRKLLYKIAWFKYNGKVIAKLSNPYKDRVDMAKSLFGILPADITLEDAQKERLSKI